MRKLAYTLSLILLFMIPWENSVIIEGFGRISRVMGVIVAVFWLGTVIATGKFRKPRPFHLLVFLYFFWSGLSVLWSVSFNETVDRIFTYIQLLGFSLLIWDLYITKRAVLAGLQAVVLGSYVSAFDTISNYFAGISRGSTPRYAASGFNANGLALLLVLALPIAWYLVVSTTKSDDKVNKLWTLINSVFIPVAVFAILLTASRTALISTIPVVWFILGASTRLNLPERMVLTAFLFGALYFLQPLIPQTSFDRLNTTQSELAEGDLSGRRNIWAEANDVFENQPLLGTGAGSFKASVDYTDKSAHNTYIGILVETGLVGFTLFSLIFITSVYHIRYQPRREAMLWLTLVTIWLISGATTSWELKKHTWYILNMVVVHAAVFKKPAPTPILAPPWRKTSPTLIPD